MRKLLSATALLALLAVPALAQQEGEDASGLSAGALAPAEALPSVRRYVTDNPTPPVPLEDKVSQGSIVPMDVELVPVPDHPDYAYFYDGDNRPVVARAGDRKVVFVDRNGNPVEEGAVAPHEDLTPDQ